MPAEHGLEGTNDLMLRAVEGQRSMVARPMAVIPTTSLPAARK